MISRVLLDSNVQCSAKKKKMEAYKHGSVGHLRGKISMESIPEKDLMADVLDKDLKTTVLKMLKELMENVENIKKIKRTHTK